MMVLIFIVFVNISPSFNPSYIFGILAYPACHSLSPAMHNAAFQYTSLPHRYTRFEISPENLECFITNPEKNWKGLSISIPHKENVISMLNVVDPAAQKIGAVNTIIAEDNILKGYNTDYLGFIESLQEHYNPTKKTCLVLGAGGAARAIIYGLQQLRAKKIYIWNRSREKAKILATEFSVDAIDDVFEVQNEIDIVINSTSVGMHGISEGQSPIEKTFWKENHAAYDIVYTPVETQFLKDATQNASLAISGERMLAFQAKQQQKLFINHDIPLSVLEYGIEMGKRSMQNWKAYKFSEAEKKDILASIVENKYSELFLSFEYEPMILEKKTHAFKKKLEQTKNTPHIIAEIKPASPSRGILIKDGDTIESIAAEYEKAGASCLSVLTDYTFFGAGPENIKKARSNSSLPIIRKDFIIHQSQIAEACALGADAVLLMKSVLSTQKIQELLDYAHALGMDALVEVHSKEELQCVLDETTACIIGVNNRNLHTLEINPSQFITLRTQFTEHHRFDEIIWVAESGFSTAEDVQIYAHKSNAILIGSSLMSSDNKQQAIRSLLSV